MIDYTIHTREELIEMLIAKSQVIHLQAKRLERQRAELTGLRNRNWFQRLFNTK